MQSLSQPKDLQDRRLLGTNDRRGDFDYVYVSTDFSAGEGKIRSDWIGHESW